MGDLRGPLDKHQLTFLRIIADIYLHHGRWPTWQYVELECDRASFDGGAVLRSLPQVGARPGRTYTLTGIRDQLPRDEAPVLLSIAAAFHISELQERIAIPFLDVLRVLVTHRLEATVSPTAVSTIEITSTQLYEALGNLSPSIKDVLLSLFQIEPPGPSSGSSDQEGNWTRNLSRELLKYQGINSLEDYIDRITDLFTEPAPAPRLEFLPPLSLVASFDYLNVVWRLHFKKPLVQPLNGERTARLSYPVQTNDELSSQVSSLAELLKNLRIPGDTAIDRTPLARLRTFLNSELSTASRAIVAVDTLEAITHVRNALQHTGTEHRGAEALRRLGIGFPVTDSSQAWIMIQRQTINALTILREEVEAGHAVAT